MSTAVNTAHEPQIRPVGICRICPFMRSVFGIGDRINPGVIIITSNKPCYYNLFVPVIMLNICKSAARAYNDKLTEL